MLFRRNNTKGATPASISSSSGGGPTSSSSSSKDSRWWWTASSNGPHPVTLCLLVYLAIFQLTIYRAKTRTNDQENEKISSTGGGMLLTATSSTTSGAAATPSRLLPVVTSSLDCHNQSQQQQLQQKQQRRGVGVWSRHPPKEPPLNPVVWNAFSDHTLEKLPYPIFVTSLPKSGTTSVWKFFKCDRILSSHNWIKKRNSVQATPVGMCIEQNILNQRPPFEDCGDVDVYTDTGYLTYEHDNGERCFYPSVDGLDAIYESYPYASFVNVVRNTESWYESLKSWSHSSLFVRIRLCNATGFPNGQSNKTEIMAMYDGHNAMIRQFVADRPTLTYLEIQLEAPETASILAQATGIDSACWKQCKPQERKCEEDRVKAAGSKAKEEETIN